MVAQVKQGAAYFVAVDGVHGATGQVRLSYDFGSGPVIAVQPASQSVVLGEPFALTVLLTNLLSGVTATVPGVEFQWQKDGVPLAGQTNSSLQVIKAQLADAGEYAVVVSSFAGTATSRAAQVTVNVPLSLTLQPAGQAVNPGSAASIEVTASGRRR